MKNILVVAPHPDDEVLGCGGVIKKYTEKGHQVYILVISRGTPRLYSEDRIINVRNEARKAHEILGVKETIFLDYHAPELDLVSIAKISSSISEVIIKFNIQELFLPHKGDIHNDHTVVFKAGLVAARPVNKNPVNEIYSYETLSETEWAPPFGDEAFIPTHFINISDQIKYKLEAMQCFKSQVKPFPSTRSLETIDALAKYRGATVGFKSAEAFMTIRTIEN